MNIDKYLRLKIGNFQNANEPLLGIFNSIAKFLDLEVPVVTIRSKKGDIYQVVQDDGSRFILWDMTYWDTFSVIILKNVSPSGVLARKCLLTPILEVLDNFKNDG